MGTGPFQNLFYTAYNSQNKDTAHHDAEPQTGAAPQDTQDLKNMVSSV